MFDEVLLKVALLNTLYNTRLLAVVGDGPITFTPYDPMARSQPGTRLSWIKLRA